MVDHKIFGEEMDRCLDRNAKRFDNYKYLPREMYEVSV